MEVTRVFDIIKRENLKPDSYILASRENKEWKFISAEQLLQKVNAVSAALLNVGLQPGDKIAIISNNRPEWNFVDFGAQQISIITVPIFPTASAHDMDFILRDSGVKAVFFSSKDILKKMEPVGNELPDIKYIYSFNAEVEGVERFSELLESGEQLLKGTDGEVFSNKINELSASIKPDDLFTILYTSGTTGKPKGVMLSHNNIVSNFKACRSFAPFDKMERALSFLPLNHVYERMLNALYLYNGICIYYAESVEKIADNAKEIKPHIFVSVPRLIERVYDKIVAAGDKQKGMKRKIFFWALDLAHRYEMYGANGPIYEFKRKIADKLVYSKWREALGGELICVASGGAALQPRLAKVFNCANMLMLEGYGLTETSPVIAVNSMEPDSLHIGTVGMVIENLDVKIAEDGEILVKGPSVMKGYYKNEEATREVIDEQGYFHTGDVGTFVNGRFLKITDRKKEIFKTSSGKYIAPLMIENKMKESSWIEQCMVIGEGQKFASALIVPAFDYVKEWCRQNKIEFISNDHIIKNEEVKKQINMFVREMNKSLAPYEQIKRPELLAKAWTVESGELTPKLSMKRKVIFENNKELINSVFAGFGE